MKNGAHSGTRYGNSGLSTARAYSPLRNFPSSCSCLLLSVSLSASFVTARHRTCQRDGGCESPTGRPTDPCPRARKTRHLIKVPKLSITFAGGVFMTLPIVHITWEGQEQGTHDPTKSVAWKFRRFLLKGCCSCLCAIIVPHFSPFITEKKLRTLKKTGFFENFFTKFRVDYSNGLQIWVYR